MTENSSSIEVRIHSITWETDAIRAIEMRHPSSEELPSFTAGAHIDLALPNGVTRSYSLTNAQEERYRYCIAVNRDAQSRGGSSFLHDRVRVGDRLPISAPRNNFPLCENASHSIFIAGGIGITPFISMIRRANTLGLSWELYYAARSRSQMSFQDAITALTPVKSRLHWHFDDEAGGDVLDIQSLAKNAGGAHLYCCGPTPMLGAFENACVGLPAAQIHVEYFSAREAPAVSGGFVVVLKRQNRSILIPPGHTILETLLAEGVTVPFSCQEGVCGTCETRVLDGIPDHRDAVLTPEERKSNRTMMICCSGSLSPTLTLDI